jgi:hypothetical protein
MCRRPGSCRAGCARQGQGVLSSCSTWRRCPGAVVSPSLEMTSITQRRNLLPQSARLREQASGSEPDRNGGPRQPTRNSEIRPREPGKSPTRSCAISVVGPTMSLFVQLRANDTNCLGCGWLGPTGRPGWRSGVQVAGARASRLRALRRAGGRLRALRRAGGRRAGLRRAGGRAAGGRGPGVRRGSARSAGAVSRSGQPRAVSLARGTAVRRPRRRPAPGTAGPAW